ncbi:MAG: BolA family transcriptional regulator [Leptospirales bacterium]|nr:BolA family transcriptional regulator [Leptospirales bacterium]
MQQLLTRQFEPLELLIDDLSDRHAGHAGARPGGETHFHIRMRAASLAGLSLIEQHRRVNQALAAEFQDGLHALSLDLAAS